MFALAEGWVDATLLPQKTKAKHDIQVVCSDVMDYKPSAQEEVNTATTMLFDAIVYNACWANFYSPAAVLQHITTNLLKSHMSAKGQSFGKLFITHPLVSSFVQQLHDAGPKTVPHTLPEQWSHSDLIGIPLEVEEFVRQVDV
jgi:hypothetical protein